MSKLQAEPEDLLLERITKNMPNISRNLKKTVRSKLREVMEGYKREQDVTKTVKEMLRNIQELESAFFSDKESTRWPDDSLTKEQAKVIEKHANTKHEVSGLFFGPYVERLGPGLAGVYFGNYQNDAMHGFGKMILDNGIYIEADFENGQPRRSVLLVNKNGTVFTGELPGSKIMGTFTKSTPPADTGKGTRIESQGYEFRKDGSIFKGQFEARGHALKKKDYGTETLADGTVSRGMWYNDIKHGQFVTITPQQECTKEYWSNGRLDKAEVSTGTKKLR